MLAFLPLIFFICSSFFLRRHFKTGVRVSLILSGCLAGVLITLITEILSLFQALSIIPVLSIWSAASMVTFILARPNLKELKARLSWRDFSRDEKTLFTLIGMTIIITGLTAMMSVTNSWDSMAYHMARVEHWIQNKTVAYYPTNIKRQLYYSPWTEYAIAQLWILRAPEASANLVQWMAMLGSTMGVSLIAQEWGASRRGQLIACLAAVTLPMSIMQCVSTQTDYAVAFWLVCFVFFLIELRKNFRKLYIVAAGLSLGLAFLTKGYSYIFMLPFLLWLIAGILKAGHWKRLGGVLAILLLALSLNIGYYQRNTEAFHSFTGGSKDDLVNASFDYKVLFGSLLRNASAHLGTPSEQVNHIIEKGIFGISHLLRIDMNDPRAIFYKRPFALLSMHQEEDTTGNLIHFLGFGLILILYCFWPPRNKELRVYMLLVCSAAVLFCWMVRWHPWISRFHLALFILFCPVCGIFIERHLKNYAIPLAVIFFVCALPWMFFNYEHQWFGPSSIWTQPKVDQYFRNKTAIEQSYKEATAQVQALGCHQIGIVLKENDWEYPLWVLLKKDQPVYDGRIEHVKIDNSSTKLAYPLGNFSPCAVIDIVEDQDIIALPNRSYKRIWDFQGKNDFKNTVYVPADAKKSE